MHFVKNPQTKNRISRAAQIHGVSFSAGYHTRMNRIEDTDFRHTTETAYIESYKWVCTNQSTFIQYSNDYSVEIKEFNFTFRHSDIKNCYISLTLSNYVPFAQLHFVYKNISITVYDIDILIKKKENLNELVLSQIFEIEL